MKISIIVPFFNDQLYLKDCIESIKSQLYCDFEAILVDDCGSDNSSAVAVATISDDPRFKIVVHQHNRGLSSARNSGLAESSGEFVYFLDADDKLASDQALHQMSNLCVDCDIVQGDFIRSNGEIISGNQNWTNATNKLINLNWLKTNHLYFTEGIIYEDVPWALKAYTLTKNVAHVSIPTYYHNLREGSLSRSVFNKAKVDSLLFILCQLMSLKRDVYIDNRIIYYAVFTLKNLLLTDFDYAYKRFKYNQLKRTGALKLRYDRSTLPKFSRILATISFSYFLSSKLCLIYQFVKR